MNIEVIGIGVSEKDTAKIKQAIIEKIEALAKQEVESVAQSQKGGTK